MTGQNGLNGYNGKDGKDGLTPLLRINPATNLWEVSYDNGITWTVLGTNTTATDTCEESACENESNSAALTEQQIMLICTVVMSVSVAISGTLLMVWFVLKKKKTQI